MGIRLVSPNDPQRRVHILKIPPTRFVQLLCPPDGIVKVWLHYNLRESVPCLGKECRNCHYPARQYGYAPVYEFPPQGSNAFKTRKAILPITENCFDLSEQDLRGWMLKVSRKDNRKNGPLLWEKLKQIDPSNSPPFDVLRMMYARWGIIPDDENTPPPSDDEDQPLLPFEQVG